MHINMEQSIYISLIQEKLLEIQNAISDANKGQAQCFEKLDILKQAKTWLEEILNDCTDHLLPPFFIDFFYKNTDQINIIKTPMAIYGGGNDENRHEVLYQFNGFENIKTFQKSYTFFKSLGFIHQNVVVVGANGCGKTTLAHQLKTTVTERTGIVIPAQKLLIIPTYDSIPTYKEANEKYENFQIGINDDKRTFHTSKIDEVSYTDIMEYGKEFNFVYGTLLSDMYNNLLSFRELAMSGTINGDPKLYLESKVDKTINIWNDLIKHREIKIGNQGLLLTDLDEKSTYDAFKMSDGERVILYLIGRVLLAPQNAIIIIDEPEIYLHKTIVDKLWNILEKERKDCMFLYLTHDLDFASSRQAVKVWIKSFKYPNSWSLERLEENEIPEELFLKILGSQKQILFCEGTKSSFDTKILEELFPKYTITPVEGCSNVINYTKAFNRLRIANVGAIGIIDRDFRSQNEIDKLKENNVFTYDVAEVENLFLIENFLIRFANSVFSNNLNINNYKNKVFDKLAKSKERQAASYVTAKLNHILSKSPINHDTNIDTIITNYDAFIRKIDLQSWYNERIHLIETIIEERDYMSAIKIYNNKGLFSEVESWLQIKQFHIRALRFISEDGKAKEILRCAFPQEI